MIYWRWCQQPFTLAVTADESVWGITIYSAVAIDRGSCCCCWCMVVVKIDGVGGGGVVINVADHEVY